MNTIRTPALNAIAAVAAFLTLTLVSALLPAQAVAEEPLVLSWEDLLPEGQTAPAVGQPVHDIMPLFDDMGPGSMQAPAIQSGSFDTVRSLDGAYVRIPGFALVLEYAGDRAVSELLLVPYFGACIHVPPPPPNQVVHVLLEKPMKLERLWDPVWITGTLHTKPNYNELGNAAYTLEAQSIEEYDD